VNGGDDLDAARQLAGLTVEALWYAYIALGGNGTMDAMEAGLAEPSTLSAHEHDVIAQAINEGFADVGHEHPVPYWRPG
jgi:hypothetical protein